MSEKTDKHILYIDILKSIACICVLVGHVISGIIKAGIQVAELLKHICEYVYFFHVPCFFFASGYLYANNQIKTWKEYGLFCCKKLLILGMPYLSCTVVYVIMSSFFSSEMNPNTTPTFRALIDVWKVPIAQYWYLYALLILFMVIPAIELVFRKMPRIYLWIGLILLTIFGRSNILYVHYIIQYAYLFYMGVIWNISNDNRWTRYFLRHANYAGVIYCLESIALYLIYAICMKENMLSTEMEAGLRNIITLLLVITMVRISLAIAETTSYIKSFLLWTSKYSFYIYLFHTWFSGTIRLLLRRMEVANCWIQTFVGVVGGFIGSILTAKLVRNVSILLFWVEPLAVIKKIKCKTVSNNGEKREDVF